MKLPLQISKPNYRKISSTPPVRGRGALLHIIVALMSTKIKLGIVNELTNKRIEFRQSHCFQSV